MSPRYFISIDIAIEVAEQLMVVQQELEAMLVESGRHVRWTHPEQLHLAMKDLGEVDEALLPHVEDALERLVEPLFPFQIQNHGVEVKPDATRPRMLCVPLDAKGGEVLSLLHKALERELGHIGIATDGRPFYPAVLLGRIKTPEAPTRREITLDAVSARRFGTSTIKDFALVRAEHTEQEVTYTVISRFTLGGRHQPI